MSSAQDSVPPRLINLPWSGLREHHPVFSRHRREAVLLTCSSLCLLVWPIPSSRKWAPREHELYLFLSLLCPQGLEYFFEWKKEKNKRANKLVPYVGTFQQLSTLNAVRSCAVNTFVPILYAFSQWIPRRGISTSRGLTFLSSAWSLSKMQWQEWLSPCLGNIWSELM